MVVLLEGSPISTEELWSSVRVTILPHQGRSPPIGGSKLIPFKNDGGRCVLGALQRCRQFFLVPFPRCVRHHNPVSELYRQFLRPPHGLVFALTCTVNFGIFFRQACAFPFQIMYNQMNLKQIDSNQVVETSQG